MIKRSKPVPIKLSITKSGVRYWFKQNEISRDNGPAIVDLPDYRAWWLNGKPHRVGGPVYIWGDGLREWFENGERHNISGPAVFYCFVDTSYKLTFHTRLSSDLIFPDGKVEFWISGKQVTEYEFMFLTTQVNTI